MGQNVPTSNIQGSCTILKINTFFKSSFKPSSSPLQIKPKKKKSQLNYIQVFINKQVYNY